ncbi:YccF domain-containing protein [Latilactobacillus curvatus]|nr:YccF domain-containing protein [Latilactobacillus curvatus]
MAIRGLVEAIGWFILGIAWSITIIGIPFGRQHFKLAALSLSPFGKQIN